MRVAVTQAVVTQAATTVAAAWVAAAARVAVARAVVRAIAARAVVTGAEVKGGTAARTAPRSHPLHLHKQREHAAVSCCVQAGPPAADESLRRGFCRLARAHLGGAVRHTEEILHEHYVDVQVEAVRHICLCKSMQRRGVSLSIRHKVTRPGHIKDGMDKACGSARQAHKNWSFACCTGSKGVVGAQCRGPNE